MVHVSMGCPVVVPILRVTVIYLCMYLVNIPDLHVNRIDKLVYETIIVHVKR